MDNDLSDVTFIIPIRIDTNERIRNLGTVILYLNKLFKTNIIVGEESAVSIVPGILSKIDAPYKYVHIPTNSPYIHRTKILNTLTKLADTPIVVNYDVDVLLKVSQYLTAANAIRHKVSDVCFPYNGRFVNINEDVLQRAITNLDIESLEERDGQMYNPNSVGGAIFFNKYKYTQAGLENENFVSWGFEDNERVVRLNKLGNLVSRIQGCLFHMNHPTSSNSSNVQSPTYISNQQEFHKVSNMTPDQLRHYVSTWSWTKT